MSFDWRQLDEICWWCSFVLCCCCCELNWHHNVIYFILMYNLLRECIYMAIMRVWESKKNTHQHMLTEKFVVFICVLDGWLREQKMCLNFMLNASFLLFLSSPSRRRQFFFYLTRTWLHSCGERDEKFPIWKRGLLVVRIIFSHSFLSHNIMSKIVIVKRIPFLSASYNFLFLTPRCWERCHK